MSRQGDLISKAALEDLYSQQRLTLTQIAAHFGVSRPTISSCMADYGLALERPDPNPLSEATLKQLYHTEGLTQQQIAQQFGITADRVSKQMAAYGIPTHRRSIRSDIPQAELERLYYAEGLDQAKIAQHFNVTISTISKRMAEYGMTVNKRTNHIDIPREVIEQLYYAEGLTQKQIGERFGVTGATIRNRMLEYGLTTRSHEDYVYIDIPQAELERLYLQENLTAPAIAAIYNCAVGVIYNRLEEHGIAIKKAGWDKVKQIVPAQRLEWSSDFAYVVGLLASDGNLQSGTNEVRLCSTDRELIDLYCACLGLRPDDISAEAWSVATEKSVHLRLEQRPPYKDQYHINFSDHIYRARLEAIGLTANKSKTLGPLAILDQYFRDFLRGEFDGDGCWSLLRTKSANYLLGIITSGSRIYLEWIQDSLRRLAGIETGGISGIDLRYQSKAAIQLGQFMYYTPDVPCLHRKRLKWQAFIDSHQESKLIQSMFDLPSDKT